MDMNTSSASGNLIPERQKGFGRIVVCNEKSTVRQQSFRYKRVQTYHIFCLMFHVGQSKQIPAHCEQLKTSVWFGSLRNDSCSHPTISQLQFWLAIAVFAPLNVFLSALLEGKFNKIPYEEHLPTQSEVGWKSQAWPPNNTNIIGTYSMILQCPCQ